MIIDTTILIIAASVSVIMIAVGIVLAITSPRSAVIGRLDKVGASGEIAGQPEQKASLREDFLWVLRQLGRASPRKNRLKEIQSRLIKADIMMRAEEYIGLVLIITVSFYAVVFLISDSILLGLLSGGIGFILPGVIVSNKINKRTRMITDQLPEALNIISSGLRAGYSFPQAVSVVIKEIEGPLTKELARVLKENRLGKPMDDALNDLIGRIENDDLEMLVTALLIQRQVGGNLAEVLDSISHTIRERVRIKGEISTLTAEGKLSGFILSVLPLAAAGGLALINPGFINPLIEEPLGIIMIVVAVTMQIIGILIIRKIVNIDV